MLPRPCSPHIFARSPHVATALQQTQGLYGCKCWRLRSLAACSHTFLHALRLPARLLTHLNARIRKCLPDPLPTRRLAHLPTHVPASLSAHLPACPSLTALATSRRIVCKLRHFVAQKRVPLEPRKGTLRAQKGYP